MIIDWGAVFDVVGALILLLGAVLCLAAALGLVRFPDVLTRMHAATKPQTLGLLLVVTGVAISLRDPRTLGLLFLVAVLQLLTAPVAAHMVGRTAYRTGQVSEDITSPDELAEDLARAGFRRSTGPEQDQDSDRQGEGGGDEQSSSEPPDSEPRPPGRE